MIGTDLGEGFQSVADDQTVVSLLSLCSRNSSGGNNVGDDEVTSALTANSTRHEDRPATGAANHGLSRRT